MGVITLQGQGQSKLIAKMLLDELGTDEIEKRKIVCGDAYSFQGDERHVILLSLVAAPNETIGTLSGDDDRRRFNVAASRARDQMWLFHSVTENDLSEHCFRRRLLQHFYPTAENQTSLEFQEITALRLAARQANRKIETPRQPFGSWFEVDVFLAIVDRGYRVRPQYPIGAKRIDLMVEGAKAQLAVECDGDFWHGPERYDADMERQRTLENQGWVFHRIRESAFRADTEGSLNKLCNALSNLGILPAI